NWLQNFEGDDDMAMAALDKDGRLVPSMVVIDEIHQGRGNVSQDTLLWKSAGLLCERSVRAVGLSATPINLRWNEYRRMLETLGGEARDSVDDLPEDDDDDWDEHWMRISSLIRKMIDEIAGRGRPDNADIEDLRHAIRHPFYPYDNVTKDEISRALSDVEANWSDVEWEERGPRLLRELHPLGRNLTLTRRGDLGDDYCSTKFRELTTENTILEWPDEIRSWFEQVELWEDSA
ncbi:uncharacterized protein METZ01_LOCUS501994, partial [marine metagenome]